MNRSLQNVLGLTWITRYRDTNLTSQLEQYEILTLTVMVEISGAITSNGSLECPLTKQVLYLWKRYIFFYDLKISSKTRKNGISF